MNRHTLLRGKTALAMALCAAACSQFSSAQVAPPVILQIDLTNNVLYFQDTSDISKYATEPNVTPLTASLRNFYRVEGIADIVAVNGQPMKGTYANAAAAMVLRTAPTPGQAIADTVRQAITVTTFEILKSDGASIGTIVASGLFAGDAPPGSPTAAAGGNILITRGTGGFLGARGHMSRAAAAAGNFVSAGGTGAFLGARGQMSVAAAAPGVVTQRNASITEDPANRQRNGGGTVRWIAHVIPMARPEVTMLPSGPAITHSSDFSLVTVAKPATQGENLSLFATGLGPVTARVDPGQPFPAIPLAVVNSPVEVIVN